MKEQILKALREHPNGLRIREISALTHIGHWELFNPMKELEEAGAIRSKAVFNMVQGECYNRWFCCLME